MTTPLTDPEFPVRLRARACACGLTLTEEAGTALVGHAHEVLRANEDADLTSITETAEFLERHLGEAFEGAAMLDPALGGKMLDLGSGNGYPGIPLAVARPGLAPLLVEASARKAGFLREVVRTIPLAGFEVFEAQVQRPADLEPIDPVRLITTRAMGGWQKILPRLVSLLAPDGEVLVWCGAEMETLARRAAWRRLRLDERKPLPGRDRSWIWRLRRA